MLHPSSVLTAFALILAVVSIGLGAAALAVAQQNDRLSRDPRLRVGLRFASARSARRSRLRALGYLAVGLSLLVASVTSLVCRL